MAKRKNDTFKIIAVVGLAFIAFSLFNRSRVPYAPGQSYIPPKPPNQTPQAVAAWVTSILEIYGKSRELWQPGGPFYKPSPEIQQVLNNMAYMPMPF